MRTSCNQATLHELQMAHQIIRNALAVMTPTQKCAWAELNARHDCDGEGTTRANERAAVIAAATSPITSSADET